MISIDWIWKCLIHFKLNDVVFFKGWHREIKLHSVSKALFVSHQNKNTSSLRVLSDFVAVN